MHGGTTGIVAGRFRLDAELLRRLKAPAGEVFMVRTAWDRSKEKFALV
jgi:hypothetical protein